MPMHRMDWLLPPKAGVNIARKRGHTAATHLHDIHVRTAEPRPQHRTNNTSPGP
jgi:hypothetical protein